MNKSLYHFINTQRIIFQFDFLLYFQGFIQNLVLDMISITNIIRNLQAAYGTDHTDIVYYDAGRLIRVMLIFDPPEVEAPEEDWYYNNRVGDNAPLYSGSNNYETTSSSRGDASTDFK